MRRRFSSTCLKVLTDKAMFSRDPFPWRYGPELMGSLKPYPRLFVSPGAGYDTTNVGWITEMCVKSCDVTLGSRECFRPYR